MRLDGIPFNLDVTLCCGQVFRWEKKRDWWYGVAVDKAFKVRQKNTELEFVNVDEEFVKHYFSLDADYQSVVNTISKDAHIEAALKAFWGLRIIRQDPWECLISYICATYKSIAAIRQMLIKLSEKFGEHIVFDGHDFYTFPVAEKLAQASVKELEACGLGYRAKYVLETSKKACIGEFNLESLRKMSYRDSKKVLLGFSGVGAKVADCVLLFSLGKLEAFPVDVWVKRAIVTHYAEYFSKGFIQKISTKKSLSNAEYERLNTFGRNYFGRYAGYAQEYLYHYERVQR
ncbi:MAG: DNA glycosylase [Candidatus Bathyarchaeia archaeon]